MSKIVPEKISIFYVKVYKSNHSSSQEYIDKPVKPSNIKVQFSQNSTFNLEEKNVRIRLEIILDGVNEEDKELGLHGEYGIEFQLHVENFEEFVSEIDGEIEIDGELGATIIGIVYSTARGIIIERTLSTLFCGVILPVISPKELLK